jgi:hypothetical protein
MDRSSAIGNLVALCCRFVWAAFAAPLLFHTALHTL